MILNEVEVAIAQILYKNEAFTPIQDRLEEVRQIILDQTFNESNQS